MAGKGISLDILANVRDALNGVGDVEKALADVESTLADMDRAGDDSTDKMSRGFRDLARKADDSADTIERKYKTTYRDIARAADDSADDAVKSQRRMGEKSAEVGQEIRQNLGEGIANAARGDFESLSDTIGDTFGGAVAGIGGIAAAGVAAAGALGLGAVVGAMNAINEKSDVLEQRASDLAQAWIDAGSNVASAQSIAAATADIITDKDKRKEVQAYADALGVDFATAARAYVGDVNAMAAVDAIALKAREENLAIAEEQRGSTEALTGAQQDQLEKNQAAIGAQRELNGVLDDANAKFEEQQRVLRGLVDDAASATEEVDELGNTVLTLPDGTQIFIDAETGQASTDLSNFKGELDGVGNTVVNPVIRPRVDLTAWDNMRLVPKVGLIIGDIRTTGRTAQLL